MEILCDGVPLPDSRLNLWGRRKRTEVVVLGHVLDLVFCANCGRASGASFKGSGPVFFVCDDCVTKHGPPPGAIEVAP